MSCLAREKQHPRYAEAKEREFQEVLAGNTKYPGLFDTDHAPIADLYGVHA